MPYLEDLEDSRTQIAATIKAITANPKPSYSIDGQSVSWESYLSTLISQLERLNGLIAVAGGPVWEMSQVM